VRHIILKFIHESVFQPPLKRLPEDADVIKLFERLSQKLSGISEWSQSVWCTLTLKGLGELGDFPAKYSRSIKHSR
jgi:hypothetical protein